MGNIMSTLNLREASQQALSGHIAQVTHDDLDIRKTKAELRDLFLDMDSGVITSVLKSDLSKYMDVKDINNMRIISLDQYVEVFMQNLLHVYDSQPAVTFTQEATEELDDDGNPAIPEESEDQTRFRALLEEVNITEVFRTNLIQARLHNTTLCEVKYNKTRKKMFVQTGFNIGNSWVSPFDDFWTDWEVFAYEKITADDTHVWVVWDRIDEDTTEVYLFTTKESVWPNFSATDKNKHLTNGDKTPLPGNEDFVYPKAEGSDMDSPIITYRYNKHTDFWGNGMDSLIEIVRSVNVLLSVANDDTIQETIRLLVLNFHPTGSTGEKAQIKGGIRNPITAGNPAPGQDNDPKMQLLQAELFNDDIIKFVETLLDMISNMFEIDNPIVSDVKETLSGIALRLRAEPLMQHWREDIGRVMKPDMELLEALINVNNLNRPKNQIDVKILDSIFLDYVEPNVVKDEEGEFALEVKKWPLGLSNPVLWAQRQNREMSAIEAKAWILKNKQVTSELQGQALSLRTEGLSEPGLDV